MHLFADISCHGYGHLAISAPVLNALGQTLPGLRLTVRSGLPGTVLRQRIAIPFEHLATASDFGFVMHDATRVDLVASAAAYRTAHLDWAARVEDDAERLARLAPDLVLSNVSYLPLAAAAQAGLPALCLCSLNWADLFLHFFGDKNWAPPIYRDILAAYQSARHFLRLTPGMPMPALSNRRDIGPIAARGRRHNLGLGGDKAILVALGGIAHRLPVEAWPRQPGLRWLVHRDWHCTHPDALPFEEFGLEFPDLLASVDALITKPGYGTFTEAASNGTPLLYQRREDWPEQDSLIDWLHHHARAQAIDADALRTGNLGEALAALWATPSPPPPPITGIDEASTLITGILTGSSAS